MNGCTWKIEMIPPLIEPTTRPSPTAPATAIVNPSPLSRAAATAERATTAPTDRSMPPVMITKVMPRAMRAK
jgi:hypothetical protein